MHPPARQVGHDRHLSSPVRTHFDHSLAACSAGARRLGNSGTPAPFAPALDMERFKDLSSDFHLVMEWRREISRALTSFGRLGRAEAPISAMVAGGVFSCLPQLHIVVGWVKPFGGRVGAFGPDGGHPFHWGTGRWGSRPGGVGRFSVGVGRNRPGGWRPGGWGPAGSRPAGLSWG